MNNATVSTISYQASESQLSELDARHLLCPLPVIKVQNRIKTLKTGDRLDVICTDPGALEDIPCWCRMYGHKVLAAYQEEREIFITIEVGDAGDC